MVCAFSTPAGILPPAPSRRRRAPVSGIDVARDGEQHVLRPVAPREIGLDVVAIESRDGLRRADDRSPERVVAPAVLQVELVDVVARLVLATLDLLQHDALLAL